MTDGHQKVEGDKTRLYKITTTFFFFFLRLLRPFRGLRETCKQSDGPTIRFGKNEIC